VASLGRFLIQFAPRWLLSQAFPSLKRNFGIAIVTIELIVIALFVLGGLAYWHRAPGLTWQECIYGRAECSTAAGTWLLAGVAAFTLPIALATVVWASRAYSREIESRLGQRRCSHHGDNHRADKEIFVTHGQVLLFRRPVGYDPKNAGTEYLDQHNASLNLGRPALASIKVRMHVRNEDGKVLDPIDVALGNIRCDDEVHVAIFVWHELHDVEITWSHATERGTSIEFYADDPLSEQVVQPMELTTQTSLLPPVGPTTP